MTQLVVGWIGLAQGAPPGKREKLHGAFNNIIARKHFEQALTMNAAPPTSSDPGAQHPSIRSSAPVFPVNSARLKHLVVRETLFQADVAIMAAKFIQAPGVCTDVDVFRVMRLLRFSAVLSSHIGHKNAGQHRDATQVPLHVTLRILLEMPFAGIVPCE